MQGIRSSADSERPHVPVEGEFRVRVPLHNSRVSLDPGSGGRLVLRPGVELVAGGEPGHGGDGLADPGACQLEFFDIYTPPSGPGSDAGVFHPEVEREVAHVLALQALACREPFVPAAIWADRLDGDAWQPYVPIPDGYRWRPQDGGVSSMPAARVATWMVLVRNWPTPREGDPMALALSYYSDSVFDRSVHSFSKSFTGAAIAAEILLGDRVGSGQRVSNRAAHLLESGDPAVRIQEEVQRLYRARNRLVHSGVRPERRDVTLFQQLLMAALPRAAAIGLDVDGLRAALDTCNFKPVPEIEHVRAGGWWAYCDFMACLELRHQDP